MGVRVLLGALLVRDGWRGVSALLTVEEAAAELRVHPATVRRMIRRGEIPAVKVGRLWRVDADVTKPVRVEQPTRVVEKHSAAYYAQLARPLPSAPASQAPTLGTPSHSARARWTG